MLPGRNSCRNRKSESPCAPLWRRSRSFAGARRTAATLGTPNIPQGLHAGKAPGKPARTGRRRGRKGNDPRGECLSRSCLGLATYSSCAGPSSDPGGCGGVVQGRAQMSRVDPRVWSTWPAGRFGTPSVPSTGTLVASSVGSTQELLEIDEACLATTASRDREQDPDVASAVTLDGYAQRLLPPPFNGDACGWQPRSRAREALPPACRRPAATPTRRCGGVHGLRARPALPDAPRYPAGGAPAR